MQGTFIFLGTGGSKGVPLIGCRCLICLSASPFNKRWRASGLIRLEQKTFLIDVGPDFRTQALHFGISKLDGVVLTHTHFDHIAGLDDLRALCFWQKDKIPCLVSQDTLNELKVRYHYLMQPHEGCGIPYARLSFQVVAEDFGRALFQGQEWRHVSYFQSGMKVTGYVVGDLAYISDIREYSEEVTRSLSGVKTLILGALRYAPSKGHFTIEEAIAFARRVGAEQTYLTHIGHELDHEETNQKLPPDIRLGYDGLEIFFEV